LNIVFLGSPAEVIEPLKAIMSSHHDLVAVVSQPARPAGRKRQLVDPPVAAFAKQSGIKTLQPSKASDPNFLNQFSALDCDVAITAAYGQILTEDFLAVPTRATINIHPSLLPAYRGATPVPAALLDGLSETGVSVLFTKKKLDAGNIICQESYKIPDAMKADELTATLFELSSTLVLDALTKLVDQTYQGDPQDDELATYCKKILKTDGVCDWSLSAVDIERRFKAYYPWPGCFSAFKEQTIQFLDLKTSQENRDLSPGSFVFDKALGKIFVGTGRGTIELATLKKAGGKPMDAPSFWNGIKNIDGPHEFKKS